MHARGITKAQIQNKYYLCQLWISQWCERGT